MYATTFWSYMACVWNTVFLISPIIYLFTGIPPVSARRRRSISTFSPFLFSLNWPLCSGHGEYRLDGRASYLSFFSMNLRALNTVLRGEQIKFHVTPKERQTGRFLPGEAADCHRGTDPRWAYLGRHSGCSGPCRRSFRLRHQYFLGRGKHRRHAAADIRSHVDARRRR